MNDLAATPPSHASAGPALSVVVPCLNEADNLAELYRRLCDACASVSDAFELVMVNDGSTDGTWPAMVALAAADPRVVGVNLSRNHGHQLALSAGLALCRGERIFMLDADLQDPPELLPEMTRLMDAGADVVYGQRLSRAGDSWPKRKAVALFYWLFNRFVDVGIPPDAGDFRLMNRRAADILLAMPEHSRFLRGMVSWVGLDQRPVHYDRPARRAGLSKYPLRKLIAFATDGIVSSSARPLTIASSLALGAAALGAALILYALGSFVMQRTVSGWTSLMAVILLLGSATLLVLGIIGEYVGRLYTELRNRPLFVIDRVIGGAPPPPRERCPTCGRWHAPQDTAGDYGHP